MKWLARLFATDPDTTRGKLLVLVVDKLIIGLIILGAIGTYQMFQSNRDAAREARLADARTKVERTRLAKDLLPFLLDNSSDVIARGYLLSATLSAGLIDPNVAIEVATELHDQGLPDHHIPRIASLALPAGLQAIARHGARLHKELRDNGNPNRASQVRGISVGSGGYKYVPSSKLSDQLQAVVKERLVWADALREAIPHVSEHEEGKIVTRRFLTRYIDGLYFLFQPVGVQSSQRLFFSTSRTLRLVGALDCVIQNWGPKREAADFIGAELSALNLSSEEDLSYALALVRVLREFANGTREYANLAPEIAVHLARLLVDNSFLHRLPWIPDDASREQRNLWLTEDIAADLHSSLQFTAGESLWLMRTQAHSAESVLISFIDEFVRNVKSSQTREDVGRLSGRYGSYAVRFSVAVLISMDTTASRAVIQKVRDLGDTHLSQFEGIRMELNALEN